MSEWKQKAPSCFDWLHIKIWFVPWMVFKTWQKLFCHHLRQEFGFLPLWMLYMCLQGDGNTGNRVNEMIFMSLKGTRFFIRDSQLLLFTQEKTSKGSSESIFKGILVIENEMGPTGLKPILFNRLLLTVSNWF